MLAVSNSFLEVIESPVDGTRPDRTTDGIGFSLGASNAMGSYVQVLDGSADWPAGFGDGYGIYLEFGNVGEASQIGDALATIGIDLAGGTTYTDWIQYLLVGGAPTKSLGRYAFYFPIRVPNGASLAVKGQSADATPVATSYLITKIYGKPTHPELVRVGTFVQTFGVDTANSKGTAFTIATGGTDGTYAQVGSALDKPIWAWEFGIGSSSTSWGAGIRLIDVAIGDATNKQRIICNAEVHGVTTEMLGKDPELAHWEGAVGDLLYVRGQGATLTSGNAAIYGIGG